MSRKYSVIVFDLGNVLLPFDYKGMLDKLDLLKKGTAEKFYDFYASNYYIHRNLERGDLLPDEFLKIMLNVCENLLDREAFCRYYSEIFREDKDVISLLPILKQRYKLILLSNTNPIHHEYGYKQYEFLKYFDKLILSHEVGALKPEPAIYKAVEYFTQTPPEEHIFIDDIPEYAEAAKEMGWDAIHFTGYNQLVIELKLRKII